MDNYLDKIKEQLKTMTEREKDEQILAQVKIMPEDKLEDVYKSLTGIKKIINMPGRDEIDEFCNMVNSGDMLQNITLITLNFQMDAIMVTGNITIVT